MKISLFQFLRFNYEITSAKTVDESVNIMEGNTSRKKESQKRKEKYMISSTLSLSQIHDTPLFKFQIPCFFYLLLRFFYLIR